MKIFKEKTFQHSLASDVSLCRSAQLEWQVEQHCLGIAIILPWCVSCTSNRSQQFTVDLWTVCVGQHRASSCSLRQLALFSA